MVQMQPPVRATAAAQMSVWRHLPNVITVMRMALVVPLAWTILQREFRSALWIVAVAGFSDALDGFLAKRYGWRSWLGGVLDPSADKLLLIACFVTLHLSEVIPAWLMWLVVGRDLVIATGAIIYHNFVGHVTPQPSIISKITTCIQILFALALLLDRSMIVPLPAALLATLLWATAVTTLSSGLHYVVVWSAKAVRARASGKTA